MAFLAEKVEEKENEKSLIESLNTGYHGHYWA